MIERCTGARVLVQGDLLRARLEPVAVAEGGFVTNRQRLFFKAGCWMAIVTAVMHMVAHLSGTQPPANDTERQLLALFEGYKFPLPGGTARSLDDFMRGFSLVFAVHFASLGGMNLLIVRRCAGDDALMTMLTRLVLACCVTTLAVSLTHFFLIPTIFIGAVTLCFGAALVGGGASQEAPARS